MQIVCLTCDSHIKYISGFLHQWKKYCGFHVTIAGYDKKPVQGDFISLGSQEDYPITKWSDGLIKLLKLVDSDLVLLLLEDYWLIRQVNESAVHDCVAFMRNHLDFARCDLSMDRIPANVGARDIWSERSTDFFQSNPGALYNFSYQASIWRRDALLKMIVPGENPWESEERGGVRLSRLEYKVAGTRQLPMKYAIVVNKGQFDKEGGWMYPPRTLTQEDWKELEIYYGY